MVHHIRHAFIDNLNNVTWMDAKTKQAAKEKVARMREALSALQSTTGIFGRVFLGVVFPFQCQF